jgi:uncharacterized protein YjbJ (UPF0337 family)
LAWQLLDQIAGEYGGWSEYIPIRTLLSERKNWIVQFETNCNQLKSRKHQRRWTMNWDIIEGNWKQFKGTAQAKWGKLTDDEWDTLKGNREQLVGKIQELYGKGRDEAEREVSEFEEEL